MEQAKTVLITGRRNFLVRALGFTAAGATLAVPVVAMETPLERIKHHMKGLEQAFADYYGPQVPIEGNFNEVSPALLASSPSVFAYAAVRAGPLLYPAAKTIVGFDDGQPLFSRG